MTNLFYVLYNKLKGDGEDIDLMCRALLEGGFSPFDEDWNIVDYAIEKNDEKLMKLISDTTEPDQFYCNVNMREYDEVGIAMIYKIYGTERFMKNKKSPITFFRDDLHVIRYIMTFGKLCRQQIIDDIFQLQDEKDILHEIIEIDKEVGNYYGISDRISLELCKTKPDLVNVDDLNLSCEDSDGKTALMIACEYNHIELIKNILDKHGDPTENNSKNDCALFVACQYSTLETFKTLVSRKYGEHKRGPDPFLVKYSNSDGMTPLRVACKYRNIEVVNFLLNADGRTDDENLPVIIDTMREFICCSLIEPLLTHGGYMVRRNEHDDSVFIDHYDAKSKKLIRGLRCEKVDDSSVTITENWSKCNGKLIYDKENDDDVIESLRQKVAEMEKQLDKL